MRAHFEPRFEQDLGSVRIHRGAAADASARAVHALAYTVGSDIVFRDGAFAPETGSGQELLAHELAHATQPAAGTAPAGVPGQLSVTAADSASEREADHVASAVLRGERAAPSRAAPAASGALLQRKEVCDAGGACWEEDDNASHAPPTEPNASYAPPDEAGAPPAEPDASSPDGTDAPLAPVDANASSEPVAASMLPLMPGGPIGTPLGPVDLSPGPVETPLGPVEPPAPPTTPVEPPAPLEAPAPAAEGLGEGVAEGVAEDAGGGILETLGEGALAVLSAPVLVAGAVGAAILTWSSSTAPAWMDESNPITGGPYSSQEEYDRVHRMSPEEREAARRNRRERVIPPIVPGVDYDEDQDDAARRNPCDLQFPGMQKCSDLGGHYRHESPDAAFEEAKNGLPADRQQGPWQSSGAEQSVKIGYGTHTTWWSADGRTKITVGCVECCEVVDVGGAQVAVPRTRCGVLNVEAL